MHEIIADNKAAAKSGEKPLFIFWAPHIVHGPLQVRRQRKWFPIPGETKWSFPLISNRSICAGAGCKFQSVCQVHYP